MQLVQVLADDQDFVVGILLHQFFRRQNFRGIGRGDFVLFARGGDCVFHFQRHRQIDAKLHAFGACDEAGFFQVLPRNVVALGADQTKDVALAAVLADKRGGQADTARCLQFRRNPKDWSGQQVDFVVNYKAPVAFPKKRKVRIGAGLVGPPCKDLISGDRHRRDGFVFARVFRDLLFCQIGFVQQFFYPLVDRGDVGRHNQG